MAEKIKKFSKKVKKMPYSKPTLVIFTLIFAIIGGYLLIKSFASTPPPPNSSACPDATRPWGTWTISGAPDFGSSGTPCWYKGHFVSVDWADIEPNIDAPPPAAGTFDWTELNRQIGLVPAGAPFMVMVLTGENVPTWFDPTATPHVNGIGVHDTNGPSYTYPLYLTAPNTPNALYLAYFQRMVNTFIDYMHANYNGRVMGLGCPVGNSTDPHPYDPHDTAYDPPTGGDGWGNGAQLPNITHADWQYFEIGTGNPGGGGYLGELTNYINSTKRYLKSDGTPEMPCLINANDNSQTVSYALDYLPTAWLKLSRIGDRYDNNDEISDDAFQLSKKTRLYYNSPGYGLHAIRTRSEMDLTRPQSNRDTIPRDAWFAQAPSWQMYWSQLWALDRGLDMHNQKKADVLADLTLGDIYHDLGFTSDYLFFDNYAGYKSPQESPGAWIAFRDNLDDADTVRFPTCTPIDWRNNCFGPYSNGKNVARYQEIEKMYDGQLRGDGVDYGVRQPIDTRDDQTDSNGNYLCPYVDGSGHHICSDYHRPDLGATNWYGLEDIGDNTYGGNPNPDGGYYPRNYGMWLKMVGPSTCPPPNTNDPANCTSQGLWRVGCQGVPVDQCQEPYGRFARRFDHANPCIGLPAGCKNTIYLDLDDSFFAGSSSKAVTVNVRYYDQGTGKFSLRYDDGHGGKMAGSIVQLHDTKQWLIQSFDITDGVFSNGLNYGSDILLQNEDGNPTSGQDVIFHTVEIVKDGGSSIIIGDITGDGKVDINDMGILLGKWGQNYPPADLNSDGIVDVLDFSILLAHWSP